MGRTTETVPGDLVVENTVSFGSPDARNLRVRLIAGTGTPEAVISAPLGSQYNRTDGPPWVYIKTGGAKGNTGWVAKIS